MLYGGRERAVAIGGFVYTTGTATFHRPIRALSVD